MTRAAPNMQLSLANARVNLVTGKPIAPQQCCELHGEVHKLQLSDEHAQRFVCVSADELSTTAVPAAASHCARHVSEVKFLKAATISCQVGRREEFGAKYVYTLKSHFGDLEGVTFLISWKYMVVNLFCSHGALIVAGGVTTFELNLPLVSEKFVSLVQKK